MPTPPVQDREELLRLDIPPSPSFVGVARTVVGALVGSLDGLDDERVEDLRLAVSEVCTNAVEAHLALGLDQDVVLRCVVDAERVEVRVEDRAAGFDADALPPRTPLEGDRHLASERGWGIQLVRSLVDEVAFVRGERGTSVRLVMLRRGRPWAARVSNPAPWD